MKKTIVIIGILLVLMLLVSGCTNKGKVNEEDKTGNKVIKPKPSEPKTDELPKDPELDKLEDEIEGENLDSGITEEDLDMLKEGLEGLNVEDLEGLSE